MKKILIVAVTCLTTLALTACGNTRDERTLSGALIGGGTGAVIGGAATGTAGGALVGGALGGVGGALIGANTGPTHHHHRCARVGYDDYGNRVCVARYR